MNRKLRRITQDLFILARDREPVSRARIAAAVIYKNRIISYGFNQGKSHPFQDRFKKNPHALFLHAEVDAIKNALRHSSVDIERCELVVLRAKYIGKRVVMGMAKPCEGCMSCLETHGIKSVIYSNEQQEFSTLSL